MLTSTTGPGLGRSSSRSSENSQPMPDLDFIFNPRSVAIVGVSSVLDSMTNRNFLKPLLSCSYRGKIFPVNPRLHEIMGLRVYRSVLEIPEQLDVVISGLPASLVP